MSINFDLDLEFFEPEEKYGPMKATVHKSGKLGFSQGAAKLIDFDTNTHFKIGRLKGPIDKVNDVLFMIPVQVESENTFKAQKAGDYWYLKAKRLLTQLGIDYRAGDGESISFEVDELKEADKRYFKLIRKKQKKASSVSGSGQQESEEQDDGADE